MPPQEDKNQIINPISVPSNPPAVSLWKASLLTILGTLLVLCVIVFLLQRFNIVHFSLNLNSILGFQEDTWSDSINSVSPAEQEEIPLYSGLNWEEQPKDKQLFSDYFLHFCPDSFDRCFPDDTVRILVPYSSQTKEYSASSPYDPSLTVTRGLDFWKYYDSRLTDLGFTSNGSLSVPRYQGTLELSNGEKLSQVRKEYVRIKDDKLQVVVVQSFEDKIEGEWYVVHISDNLPLADVFKTYSLNQSSVMINSFYTKDKNVVYFEDFVVSQADPSTFVALGDTTYAKDKSYVFYRASVIEGADPATFSLLSKSSTFSKDKAHMFAQEGTKVRLIDGANPSTFTPLLVSDGTESVYGKDSQNIYCNETKIVGADVATFVAEGKAWARDKNQQYDMCSPYDPLHP